MTLEEEKLTLEKQKHYRDEQFWFTAATVGFNGVLMGRETSAPFAIMATIVVSLLAMHLILIRWVAAAGRQASGAPDPTTAKANERLRYTRGEVISSVKAIPYIVAELSGTCFYLVIILFSVAGVIWRNWNGL